MDHHIRSLIDALRTTHHLSFDEYKTLVAGIDAEARAYAAELADAVRREVFGTDVYIRGLIELTSYCKNDCLYCGIRRSNACAKRYRLTPEEVLSCCRYGYDLGFRTFVLQGGEDAYFTDDVLVPLVSSIRKTYPDCAITLSLGERSFESYRALFEAGANRYLLRHETADAEHYASLDPSELSWQHRMDCLRELKRIGFQTGCGFMVGSPGQTPETLAKDLFFVQEFQPAMCGIGPFIPHRDTPFANEPAGTLEMTLYLLSLLRLIKPGLLLPATTALGTIHPEGRERGLRAGANVIMPNLSPAEAREKYMLYNNKLHTGVESAEGLDALKARVHDVGYHITSSRGDSPYGIMSQASPNDP